MVTVLQALWLLDEVEFDEDTQRVTLRGIFNSIRVEDGAGAASGAAVFFAVRGVHDEVRLTLRYVDLRTNMTLITRPVRVEGTPLDTIDFTVRVNEMPVPHAGVYVWELLCGEDVLGSVRVEAFVNGIGEES